MFLDELRDYCLSLPHVEEDLPFGPDTLVFKVGGKLFALVDMGGESVNLKCDPDEALLLRESYAEVIPGWHMNKKHWNTVMLQTPLPDDLIREWIDNSYKLVFNGLPKKTRQELGNL